MKTNKRKNIVDTYNTIYSVDIVVAKNADYKYLNKYYMYTDGCDLESSINDGVASVTLCTRRSDNKNVIIITWNSDTPRYKIDNKKAYMINTMAHEATHAAVDTWYILDENVDIRHQEPFAYFVGWVAECIYRTISK